MMSIITGVAGDRLSGRSMAADVLGDALNIARRALATKRLHGFDA